MLTTTDINKYADELCIKNFIGVFPLDLLPNKNTTNITLIINTHTSNLIGQHWVAVHIKNGIGYVFDPLGHAPPYILSSWMTRHCTTWTSNKREIQSIFKNTCGYFCLHFLYNSTIKFPYVKLNYITKLIYPIDCNQAEFENILCYFINSYLKCIKM